MLKMVAVADANAGSSNNRRIRLPCELVCIVMSRQNMQNGNFAAEASQCNLA